MRERLIDHVRGLFRNAANTPRNRELEEEILQNTLDRYDDLIAQGVSETDAYTQAAANIGDIRRLLDQPVDPVVPVEQPRKKRPIVWIIVGVVVLILVAQVLLFGLNYAGPGGFGRLENQVETIENRVESITEPIEEWADQVEDILEGERPRVSATVTGGTKLSPKGITEVKIDWVSGNVLVEVGIDDQLVIYETGADKPEWELEWREENGVVSIDFGKGTLWSNIPGKDLTVQIPASLADSLSLVRVDTTSADVRVEDLHLRRVALSGISGDLDAQVTCNEFYADSTSGTVTFTGTARDVEVDTVSGSVAIQAAETPDELSVDTTSGAVTVSLPENRSFEAEFDSVSGSLSCEHAEIRRNEAHYTGTENTRPAELDFDTVSGSVKIVKAK